MVLQLDVPLLIFLAFVTTFLLTYFLTRWLIKTLTIRGSIAEDYHKPNRPFVPWPGGPAILSSVLMVETLLYFITEEPGVLSIVLVTLIAGMVGLADDKWKLGGAIKPVLLILAGLPIIFLETYYSHPVFPFFGGVRLTIVYPILVLGAVPIVTNAANMLDVLNGVLSGTMVIISIPLMIALVLQANYVILAATMPFIASSLAFYIFHRYPSKIFPGDSGSLALGALFASLVIVGRVEIVAIVAFLPAILNSFFILSSVKRLVEHRSMALRPITLLPDGRLAASKDPKAPITLVRMILLEGSLSESEVASSIFKLSAFSSFLAILTAVATWGV